MWPKNIGNYDIAKEFGCESNGGSTIYSCPPDGVSQWAIWDGAAICTNPGVSTAQIVATSTSTNIFEVSMSNIM